MKIVDLVTYNGEKELWDIRYNVLKEYVDEFIVCEANQTFSGLDKPYYFDELTDEYPDVAYFKMEEPMLEKYRWLAEVSPNTSGASHWKREFMQKEYIKETLEHLSNDDLVFVGDVDEIWEPVFDVTLPLKLRLDVYTYWLNNRSSEQFWGTLVAPYGLIKNQCLNHLRTHAPRSTGTWGWHFTSMGGYNEVERKLRDSYTDESYFTPAVQEALAQNIADNRDFLGRGFTYTLDESNWPQYLKDNRAKYAHLCRTPL